MPTRYIVYPIALIIIPFLYIYFYEIFEFLEVDLFNYPDFLTYKITPLLSPNFAYGYFIKLINLNLNNSILVIVALSIHFLFFIVLILHFRKNLNVLGILISTLYFSANPYLAASAFLFDTILFVKIFIICALLFDRKLISPGIFILCILICSCFRFSILLLAIPYFFSTKTWMNINKIHFFTVILAVTFIIFAQGNYMEKYEASIVKYNWDQETFSLLMFLKNEYLSWFFVYFTKLILLLGGREAMYTEGISFFIHNKSHLQLYLAFLMGLTNIIACILFFKCKNFSVQIKLSFIILIIGALATVSNSRYSAPYMPLLGFSIGYFFQKIIKTTRIK